MSHHLEDDDDDLQAHQGQRELTLSTSSILGIFFGLALSWALFFGFGYKMGAKTRQPIPATTSDSTDASTSTAEFNSFKPAPGSPASQPAANAPSNAPSDSVPANSGTGPLQTMAPATRPPDPTAVTETPPPSTKPAPIQLHPALSTTPQSPPTPVGNFVVQVAAVSHQEDADLLVNALHSRGYAVSAHLQPDQLIHIQVGPFNNRKDADAMRQQLLADGYNAIVK